MIGELSIVYKILGGVWFIATMGFGYILNDLKSKIGKNESKREDLSKQVGTLEVQVGKLEANTVTKTELSRVETNLQDELKNIQIALQKDIRDGIHNMKMELKEDMRESINPLREDLRILQASLRPE